MFSCGQQRTVPVMSEQPDRPDVVFRCERCWRRQGRGPDLAAAARDADGGWRLWVTRRADRAAFSTVAAPAAGGPVRKLIAFGPYLETSTRRVVLVPLPVGAAGQLACRGCPAAPRRSWAALVELAKQAAAAGRRDIYL
jgi:hypothetical protein